MLLLGFVVEIVWYLLFSFADDQMKVGRLCEIKGEAALYLLAGKAATITSTLKN